MFEGDRKKKKEKVQSPKCQHVDLSNTDDSSRDESADPREPKSAVEEKEEVLDKVADLTLQDVPSERMDVSEAKPN